LFNSTRCFWGWSRVEELVIFSIVAWLGKGVVVVKINYTSLRSVILWLSLADRSSAASVAEV